MSGHDALNAAIRAAAGRSSVPAAREAKRPVGDIGIGRGGTCIPGERVEPVSMGALIRATRLEQRERREQLAIYFDGEGRGWVG